MIESRQNVGSPAKGFVPQIVELIIPLLLIVFTLWQGSYFPIQFLMMTALLLLAFILFGKSLTITKEAAMLFAISLLYCVSLLVFTENHYAGLIETLRTLIFPLTLLLFLNTDPGKMEKALFIALLYIAVLGLLEVSSVIYIHGGVDESVGRLHSTIQYANMTALLMLTGILYSIKNYVTKSNIWSLCYCAVFAVALYLTGSRTTLLIALAVCALYIYIISQRRGKIIVVCALLSAMGVIAALGMLTEIRIFRMSVFESTLVERWITFQDAFEMLHGRWFLGIGAGNWQEWQLRFQSAPYYVRYIHNYYLQLLLDGGILAPALFCAATLPAAYRGIRSKSVHGVILIAFMLHSLLDIAFIFAAGAMIAMFSLSRLTVGGNTLNIGRLRYAAVVPLLAVTVLQGSELHSTMADTHRENGNLEASMRGYKAALALNPLNTDLYFRMAQSTLDIGLAEEYVRAAIERNPRDSRSIAALAQIESRRGNYAAALELSGRLIENRRFSEDYRSLRREIASHAVNNAIIDYTEYWAILAELDAILLYVNPLHTQFHRSEIVDDN
ncbi:MAG: O-antigen ligase family protein [Defluviitaleaceae bacterium]|nr:O-antigen ligase family protein [Defluviitaleaceae bacterium]